MRRRPRIMAVLFSFENGGSERMAAVVACNLQAQGYPVDVCATHSRDGPIAARLRGAGLPCFGMDVESRSRLARRWCLYRLFKRRRTEVLHVQHFAMLALCYWPARLAGVRRIVVTEHSDEPTASHPALLRMARRFAPKADVFTVIHADLRPSFARQLAMPPERIHVVLNGIDLDVFRPVARDVGIRATMGVSGDQLLVGCVARLHPDKNHAILLQALAALPAASLPAAGCRLVLIGDGSEQARLQALAQRLGVADSVRFLGDRKDVERLIPQLDLLVLASRSEGLPLVLLEGMACAVPCLATAVGGIPSLFSRGGGELVPPGDVQALAVAMARILSSPAVRESMASKALDTIRAHYGMHTMVQNYLQLLDPDKSTLNEQALTAGIEHE